MKKLIYLSSALVMFSCSENTSGSLKTTEPTNVIEEAESHGSSSISKNGSRYGENQVDKIYGVLMSKDKNLKKLDERISSLQNESRKTLSENGGVLARSAEYYKDAKSKTAGITDSLAKNQTLEMIKQSEQRFNLQSKKLRELIAQAQLNQEKINDTYIIFKIRKTIPEIEKYQNDNPLELKNLLTYINKQTQLIAELRKL